MTTPAAGVPAPPPPETGAAARTAAPAAEPILCSHCGRTASNGISCQGFCVADADY